MSRAGFVVAEVPLMDLAREPVPQELADRYNVGLLDHLRASRLLTPQADVDGHRTFREYGGIDLFQIKENPWNCSKSLEPISKLLEQHGDACELHKPEEVCGVVLPANQQAPFPWQPRKEALDEPAPLVASQMAAILGFEFPRGSVRRDHVHAGLLQVVSEGIAVVGPIANKMLGLGLQPVEVEPELDHRDRMMS